METLLWLLGLVIIIVIGIVFQAAILALIQSFLLFCRKVYKSLTSRTVKFVQLFTVLIFISYCLALFGSNVWFPQNTTITIVGQIIVILLFLILIFWGIFGLGWYADKKYKDDTSSQKPSA